MDRKRVLRKLSVESIKFYEKHRHAKYETNRFVKQLHTDPHFPGEDGCLPLKGERTSQCAVDVEKFCDEAMLQHAWKHALRQMAQKKSNLSCIRFFFGCNYNSMNKFVLPQSGLVVGVVMCSLLCVLWFPSSAKAGYYTEYDANGDSHEVYFDDFGTTYVSYTEATTYQAMPINDLGITSYDLSYSESIFPQAITSDVAMEETGDTDTDQDGMPDWWELLYHLNPADPGDRFGDADGDGLANCYEYIVGTSPLLWDTDGGGLSDGSEVTIDEWGFPQNIHDPLNPNDDASDPIVFTNITGNEAENGGMENSEPMAIDADPGFFAMVWESICTFVETLIWSPSPIDNATFEALEETYQAAETITDRNSYIDAIFADDENPSGAVPIQPGQ